MLRDWVGRSNMHALLSYLWRGRAGRRYLVGVVAQYLNFCSQIIRRTQNTRAVEKALARLFFEFGWVLVRRAPLLYKLCRPARNLPLEKHSFDPPVLMH